MGCTALTEVTMGDSVDFIDNVCRRPLAPALRRFAFGLRSCDACRFVTCVPF